jgi:hypothetical protein
LNQFIRYHANARTEANERAITDETWALGNPQNPKTPFIKI